jgi:hypothetical protein
VSCEHISCFKIIVSRPEQIWQMFKKKLSEWSMLPAEVEVTHSQRLVLPGFDSYNFFHTRDDVLLLFGTLIMFSVAAVCIRRRGGPLFRGLLTRPKDLLRFQVTSSLPRVNVGKIRESSCAEKIRKVLVLSRDGSHRDNFGGSLETLSAVESQFWIISRQDARFLNS